MQYLHFDLTYRPAHSHWNAHIPGGATDLSAWPERMHPPIEDPVIRALCGRLQGHNPAQVTGLMRCIILEYTRANSSTLTVAGLVIQLIGHLLENRNRESPLDARHAKTIESAMQHIQQNCHTRLDIESLARRHGLSPTHFRRLFGEHFQQSPRSAHLEAKMRAACDCLIYSDLRISEIADRLGFTNVHNFSRAFRNAMGQAPTTYRAGLAH